MKTRIITAAVGVPLLLVMLLALPKLVTAIAVGAAAAVGAYELLSRTQLVRHTRLVVYTAAAAFLVSLWSFYGAQRPLALLLVLVFWIALFSEMMASHIKLPFQTVAICLVGGLLIPYLLTALVRILTMSSGRHFVLIPFVLAFLSDTGAYFTGRAIGRHKLAPAISPNKTVEGVLGGVVGAIVGMLLYALIMHLAFHFYVNYLNAVIYGIFGSAVAVFGDLCFSVIKRQTGIKDYGVVFPGHGGILDRFDSMCLVAPVTEVLLMLLPVAIK